MKISVIGAGGAGGSLGGRLARAGQRVSLVARGAHLQALQAG
ncbi:MAG: 2-dehydropantoate 2-reductase N-terminal domain-containing protein, partial [Burkholderiaceae bacterium]